MEWIIGWVVIIGLFILMINLVIANQDNNGIMLNEVDESIYTLYEGSKRKFNCTKQEAYTYLSSDVGSYNVAEHSIIDGVYRWQYRKVLVASNNSYRIDLKRTDYYTDKTELVESINYYLK